jgi:DHA3 family macrolide efflux protein-like MFS transporter
MPATLQDRYNDSQQFRKEYLNRMSFLKALRLPQIALLWTSQVLSAIGDYLYTIAVMWIAVKTSGSDAGLVAGAEAIAMFTFGLLGGVCADRWNRRVTMVTVDLVRAATVLLLPVLALTGRLQFWHLIGVAVVIGSLSALFDPALQASLPALTGDTQTLQATNGLMDITRRMARMLGPSMAGLLIAFLSLAHFFTLDAVSFLISALAVLALGSRFAWRPARAEKREEARGVKGLAREVLGGMRLVNAHRPLFWSLLAVGLSNFVWSIAFVVGVPLLVTHGLGNSVGVYGLIVGAYGVGNVLSNLVIGSLRIKRRVPLIFLGKGILGIGFLLLAISTSVPMALFASALAAIGGPMSDIMILTMLQTDLPSDQIGKAYSLLMILESVGSSLGYLVAVPFFGLVSVPLGIALSALPLLLISVPGLLRFGLREPEVPALVAERRG